MEKGQGRLRQSHFLSVKERRILLLIKGYTQYLIAISPNYRCLSTFPYLSHKHIPNHTIHYHPPPLPFSPTNPPTTQPHHPIYPLLTPLTLPSSSPTAAEAVNPLFVDIQIMFFPEEESDKKTEQKIIYIYETNSTNRKPYELKVTHKKLAIADVRRTLGFNNVRLFNSDGSEYFEDDLKYIKNKTVLYATKGEDFDSGSCFGEYEMSEKLGEGGFGNVFLAKHRQTGQKFAIKVIKTENIGSVSDIDNIFVEAEILKSLNHENIVKVHNCLTLKNMQVAIIMEFLQGGELLKYVEKEGRLDEKTAQIFFRQIVKGMKYCHQNNLIHRDLKLENILLVNSEEMKIKIIDFGIAGAISFFTQEDLDTGSLAYMAPECFTNTKDYKVDGRIDVWATGVILFCMLNGFLPFKGANNYETIEAIKLGKYKLDPAVEKTLTEACLEVLRLCLEVNPKRRINMEDLADHPWITRNIFQSQLEKEEPRKTEPAKEEPKEKPKNKPLPSKSSISALPAAKPKAGYKFTKK